MTKVGFSRFDCPCSSIISVTITFLVLLTLALSRVSTYALACRLEAGLCPRQLQMDLLQAAILLRNEVDATIFLTPTLLEMRFCALSMGV